MSKRAGDALAVVLFLGLALLSGACASIPREEQLALELVSREAPARAFQAVGAETLVSQQVVDGVREALSPDDRLIALAQLPQGVHPFLVVVFVERDEAAEALMTSVYWSKIRGKWRASVDPATVESIVRLANSTFDCTAGPVVEFLFGATLIHWPEGRQVTCDGGWGSEQGAAFAERFQPLLDHAEVTYEPR